MPRGKSQKQTDASQRRQDAKLKAEESKLAQQNQKKVLTLANKVMILLPDMRKKLEPLAAAKPHIGESVSKELDEHTEKCIKWQQEAASVLQKAASGKEFGWDSVTFENEKDITLFLKYCNQTIKQVRADKKAAKAKAKVAA